MTAEMEQNYDGLEITTLESVILHTHSGDDVDFSWSDWLNFKKYTMFQWIVVDGILLMVIISFICVVYRLHCRASNAYDPYRNINYLRLEYTKSLIDEDEDDVNTPQRMTMGSTPGILMEMRIL